MEACEWLTTAMRGLEVPNIDPTYAKMRAVWFALLFKLLSKLLII